MVLFTITCGSQLYNNILLLNIIGGLVMGSYIMYARSKSGNVSYVANISPLLWTNEKSKAKKFNTKGELIMDLTWHIDSLEKMEKELGLKFEVDTIT
jgi:hypothetical protein